MKTIAIANLKGGVGKSTTTLFLSLFWAMRGKKILVLDLDPQANTSFMLLSKDGVRQHDNAGKSLRALFDNHYNDGNVSPPYNYIVDRASDIDELVNPRAKGKVSILPATHELYFREYELDRRLLTAGRDPIADRAALIDGVLKELTGYDFVLMDCPPGYGTMTRAALRCTSHIIIPTIADFVSSRSLSTFIKLGIRGDGQGRLGSDPVIVISKYRRTNVEDRTIDTFRRARWKVAVPYVPLRVEGVAVTENLAGRIMSFNDKFSDSDFRSKVRSLSDDLLERFDT